MNTHPGCHYHNWSLIIRRLLWRQNCGLSTFCPLSSQKNHYEVMGLTKTCSQSDIKEAFLRLSKELHPDVQPSSQSGQQHSKFVRLNTAYSALIKPHSRRLYDAALVAHLRPQQAMHVDGVTADKQGERGYYPDPSFWANRNSGQGSTDNGRTYQGKRWSNSTVATGVVVFMLIGMFVSYTLTQMTVQYNQRVLAARNHSLSQTLHEVRRRARTNDRMAQIQAFMDEISTENTQEQYESVKDTARNKKLLELLAKEPPAGKEM